MNKLRRDLKISLAGMCCGLFSISVFLLAARIDSYYAYLSWLQETRYAARYDRVEDLWWLPVVTWHVVLTIMASLLMHRYLASDRVSPFLRWQAIGVSALIGWALSIFTVVGLRWVYEGDTTSIRYLLNSFRFGFLAQFVSTVFAANVLFGSAIQAASSEDIREAGQSPTADNAI